MLSQPEQRFVGQREHRTAQHAGERDFVGGTGQRSQQIHDVVNFLLGVKRMAADQIIIDAVFPQRFFIMLHVGKSAKQYRNVTLLNGPRDPLLSVRFHGDPWFHLIDHAANSPGDEIGFLSPRLVACPGGGFLHVLLNCPQEFDCGPLGRLAAASV